MSRSKLQLIFILFSLVIAWTTPAIGQQTQPSDNPDLNSEIESMRADTRADKVAIITELMNFTPQESSAFWLIYKKYANDLAQLNDGRVELIKSYADKYPTLTNAEAKQMVEKSFDLEARRVELRKKYFKEFSKQMPATTVARFFQLEHRLDLIIDAELASNLPPVLTKPTSASAQTPAPQWGLPNILNLYIQHKEAICLIC
jgi:hypothetical protein